MRVCDHDTSFYYFIIHIHRSQCKVVSVLPPPEEKKNGDVIVIDDSDEDSQAAASSESKG